MVLVFHFEKYTLDVSRGCLRIADQERKLRPKSFDVLRHLVENAGRLVTKDELINLVWPNVMVGDESLSKCVSEVRNAIADADQRIIKTVPRRGYRFEAPVSQVRSGSGAAAQSTTVTLERGQASSEVGREFERCSSKRPSIAVLPFVNLGNDPLQEYFSDGITEDIITELSRFSELIVIARNSTFQYKGKTVDVRLIGRELGVRYALEGSIRRSANRVRITAQLIDATTGTHRWAERYDREIQDIFAVEDEIARTIASILAAHVNKAEAERTLMKPPTTWEAYDYYMRGAEFYSLSLHAGGRTTVSHAVAMREARYLLEQSLSIDPHYARAYAMLSWTRVRTYLEPFDDDYLNPKGLDLAEKLAQKAVQLDGNLPEARAHLGWVLLFKRRHDAAIAEFERAVTLNPNFTDHRFGLALAFAGKPERAIEVLQANMRLDPFQPPSRLGFMGHAFYMLKRYPEAIPLLREAASRLPDIRIQPLWLAAAYAQSGQFENARRERGEVLRIEPSFTIGRWKHTAVYKDTADAEHLFDGLRKAGLRDN